jgi:hypothetical protein
VDEEVAHEEEEEEEIVTDVAEERWGEILERIGAYAAGDCDGNLAIATTAFALVHPPVNRGGL